MFYESLHICNSIIFLNGICLKKLEATNKKNKGNNSREGKRKGKILKSFNQLKVGENSRVIDAVV